MVVVALAGPLLAASPEWRRDGCEVAGVLPTDDRRSLVGLIGESDEVCVAGVQYGPPSRGRGG